MSERAPLVRASIALVVLTFAYGCSGAQEGITGDAGASACGSCHTTEYAEWSTSRLASSGTSPVFQALSASAASEWGQPAEARCVGCHQPGYGGDHGIGCVACHSATGNEATRDGLLTVDLEAPISGPFGDPLSTPAHGSRAYGFLESPDLCGTCHELTGPNLLHETTLDEYETSPAAAAGSVCATCHMPPTSPDPIAEGETNVRARSDHSFVGVDPPWGATATEHELAAGRTLGLLRLGLRLRATRAPVGSGIEVSLTNQAGHSVPTGATSLRSLWVDVAFTAADGTSASPSRAIALGSQPTLDGSPVALITEADAVEPHELAPGATMTVNVAPPSSLPQPAWAVVTLEARAIRAEVLDALGLTALSSEVPTHEVAVVRVAL
jgi:Cytochrome c554 and c-prime